MGHRDWRLDATRCWECSSLRLDAVGLRLLARAATSTDRLEGGLLVADMGGTQSLGVSRRAFNASCRHDPRMDLVQGSPSTSAASYPVQHPGSASKNGLATEAIGCQLTQWLNC